MSDETLAEKTVFSTRDYEKFKYIAGNRNVATSHLRSLIQSLEARPELAATRPILVNTDFEIIDGQHRFEASRALGLPVYYIVANNIDITTARLMNSTQRAWKLKEYLDSYVKTGHPQYVQFSELLEEYPIPISAMILYCVGFQAKAGSKSFRNGSFKIMKDRELLRYRLDSLKDTSQYFENWNDIAFCIAFFQVLKNDKFDPERFLQKLASTKMERQTTTRDYLREMERVYNFNSKPEAQVRLF